MEKRQKKIDRRKGETHLCSEELLQALARVKKMHLYGCPFVKAFFVFLHPTFPTSFASGEMLGFVMAFLPGTPYHS